MKRLAIDGGRPVRATMLPYGHQTIEGVDEDAVVAVLRSGWLTTGPEVERFERAFADRVGAAHALAVANGTAALHAAAHAAGIGPGDEVMVPTMSFAATANAAVFVGARPVFVDVDPETLLVDPESVRARLSARTRGIVAVDFAGQPANYDALRAMMAESVELRPGVALIADAAHSLGATDSARPVGSLADISTFSLHPVKHVTAGEGGVVVTDDAATAERVRRFRNHGISRDFRARAADATWEYQMMELGYNYRLSDLQCGLARAQLTRLDGWLTRRREIAARYDGAFADLPAIRPLATRPNVQHAYHLYVIRLTEEAGGVDRRTFFRALRAENIGVNVHYLPVHLHPYYREVFGTGRGDCPVAEAAYEQILTLPLFHGMADRDADDVVEAVEKVLEAYNR